MTNKSRFRKKSDKAALFLTGFFVLLVSAIFVMSLTSTTSVAGSMQVGQNDTVKGEVVAVDNLHHIGMMTVRSEGIGNFPNDKLNIFLDENTTVKICNEREPSKDIDVSRNATVTYHEVRGWLPVADAVSEHC
jgi:hypothetical protein